MNCLHHEKIMIMKFDILARVLSPMKLPMTDLSAACTPGFDNICEEGVTHSITSWLDQERVGL